MFSKILLLSLMTLSTSWAFADTTSRNASKKSILELVDDGYYFSVVPWMKEYLVQSDRNLDREIEATLDKMLYVTGVKPFESLPEEILKRSRSGNIRYILAKRLFRKGKAKEALSELAGIKSDHSAYPFVSHLKATIHSSLNNHSEAEAHFKDCIRVSENRLGKVESLVQRSQLETNRDYCIAGIGRVQFAKRDFRKSEVSYLDIPKDSFVWPEILFDEAWASYYVKNYNRTLGKLISYKAPVFDFIFKPEVEVLKALTYLKMCLYQDAKKTVDDFYSDLLTPSRDLRTHLLAHGKDYRHYYSLMSDYEERRDSPQPIINSILKSIRKDAAFLEMKSAITASIEEYNRLKSKPATRMTTAQIRNIKTLMDEYRSTLGAYVRAGMVSKYAELYTAFEGMSYIKLEVLAQRKEKLYQTDSVEGSKRGDVKYIERNDKQYFWTFNGEFWADELGDYVFALRSEC
ncbi:MAG TPA: hypothetical protein VNJ01_03995 [Bacteriovoracaceae bacterium]|nr:hypothetical protein [Bacteriovoracaceae bacterium]